MRLLTGITAFNALEFLPKCVEQFLTFSDVLICYQDISHVGERRDVSSIVEPYRDKVFVDKFVPSTRYHFKSNEMAKHTQMLDFARKHGYTNFILAAVDHFYDTAEVNTVKEQAGEYDVTFTRVHTYFKEPTWQLTPMVDFYMPFICKIHETSKFTRVANYPVFVDPACKITPHKKWQIFDFPVHNYSSVRLDPSEKFKNRYVPMQWSSRKKQRLLKEMNDYDIELNPGVEYYHGRKIKIVPNYFGL